MVSVGPFMLPEGSGAVVMGTEVDVRFSSLAVVAALNVVIRL